MLLEPADIFFAQRSDLDAALIADGEPCPLARDHAAAQRFAAGIRTAKTAYEQNRDRTPPWTPGADETPDAMDAERIEGVPGSAGAAEGIAYVVRTPDDFAGFPPGAVLVARTTAPAWTPLFHNAAAVVTESGGALSHGAVTAREIGIPAVMGARGCVARLSDGQRVRVDGSRGTVSILADHPGP